MEELHPDELMNNVSFSDNEKTGYKVRELKSVQVDAVGVYLKLNIYKNHVNKRNPHNQVGIIAINVIGDKLGTYYDPDQNYTDVSDKDPALEGFSHRPDYVSPLDDLAFDMYQDPTIARMIRKLYRSERETAIEGRYEAAKRFKHARGKLMKVGEKMGKLVVEMQQALENKDYDKFKEKNFQWHKYRNQAYKDLNLPDLTIITAT